MPRPRKDPDQTKNQPYKQIVLPEPPEGYKDDWRILQAWLYTLTPIFLQGLLENMQHASGNERIRILKELVDITLTAKPFVPAPKITSNESPFKALFDSLPAPLTEEEEAILVAKNIPDPS